MELQKNMHHVYRLWMQSYFVKTIGNANEEVIGSYVQGQIKGA